MTQTQEATTQKTPASAGFDKLVMKRTFAATPERVFEAWSRSDLARKWMCPPGMTNTEVEIDARVGGRYRIVMAAPDGATHVSSGVYEEIVANERLVFSWKWDHDDLVTRVTVEMRPTGDGKTELTLTHAGFTSQEMCDDHEQGWTGCFEKLVKAV